MCDLFQGRFQIHVQHCPSLCSNAPVLVFHHTSEFLSTVCSIITTKRPLHSKIYDTAQNGRECHNQPKLQGKVSLLRFMVINSICLRAEENDRSARHSVSQALCRVLGGAGGWLSALCVMNLNGTNLQRAQQILRILPQQLCLIERQLHIQSLPQQRQQCWDTR